MWFVLSVLMTALATTRLQITTEEPATVTLGGTAMASSLGDTKHSRPHLESGTYPVSIRDRTGRVVYEIQLVLPPSGDIRGHWSREEGLSISGPGARTIEVDTAPQGLTDGRAAGIMPDTPYQAPPDQPAAAIDNSGEGSRDSSGGGSTNERAGGAMPSAVSRAASSAASSATSGSLSPQAVTAGASGVSSVVRNAQSGTSFGPSSSSGFTAQRAYEPPPVTGTVTLSNPSGRALVVFANGMTLLEYKPGDVGPKKAKLGVGFVDIAVFDPITNQQILGGSLKVEEDVTVDLVLKGDVLSAPKRSWVWTQSM